MIKTCERCGKEFKAQGNRPRFCSQECWYNKSGKDNYKRKHNKICTICGTNYQVRDRQRDSIYCSYTCHQVGEGRKGGMVRAEQLAEINDSKEIRGYGKKFKYVKYHGNMMHRAVVEQFIGRKLSRHEFIHHKDGDEKNNDISNLQITNASEHPKLHAIMRRKKNDN